MSLQEINELLGKDMDFDEEKFCRDMGRRNAKIEIYKEQYKRIYTLSPTKFMSDNDEILDDLKYKCLKNICIITFNMPYRKLSWGGINECEEINSVLGTRSWISKVLAIGAENLKKDKETKTHPHIHACVELSRLYSPKQIAQMLFRIKSVKKLGLVGIESIDVKKGKQVEKDKMSNYCTKGCWNEKFNVEVC